MHFIHMAMFGGWMLIREKVIKKLKLCRDVEFSCVLLLLDEVSPLTYLHYPAVFRSGNLQQYISTMVRFAVLSIISFITKHIVHLTLKQRNPGII